MAETHLLILLAMSLLQAVTSACDNTDPCVAVRPCDNAANIKSLNSTTEKKLAELQAALAELTSQLATVTTELGALKRDVGPKVAFSTSMAETSVVTVSSSVSQTLVFKNVFFNNGNAYNPATGYFTAPQKGAYLFTYTTYEGSGYYTGGQLMKNGVIQVSTERTKGQSDNTSQTVILSLNAGDKVNVVTWGGTHRRVYDDKNHHTTFNGFLLFPL